LVNQRGFRRVIGHGCLLPERHGGYQ